MIAVAVLAIVANKGSITDYIAGVWMESAKKRVKNEDALGFRYAKIDSLYERKRYAYFLFVEDGLTEKDTLSLPRSAFDFLIAENRSMQLYRVIGVTERMDGNLYQLNKIDIE